VSIGNTGWRPLAWPDGRWAPVGRRCDQGPWCRSIFRGVTVPGTEADGLPFGFTTISMCEIGEVVFFKDSHTSGAPARTATSVCQYFTTAPSGAKRITRPSR